MKTIVLEIRDRATMFFVLATRLDGDNPARVRALRRCGYHWDSQAVMLTHLSGRGVAHTDPYEWGDRTYKTAHHYITEHFAELADGDVVDVEFILGETKEPKEPEEL